MEEYLNDCFGIIKIPLHLYVYLEDYKKVLQIQVACTWSMGEGWVEGGCFLKVWILVVFRLKAYRVRLLTEIKKFRLKLKLFYS